MKSLRLVLGIILLLSSCNYDSVMSKLPDGTYTGIFGRSSPNAKYESSNVVITFNNRIFGGSSSKSKYPAICNGKYKISGSRIEFFESCIWTAEFDWSLILSGKFDLIMEGDEVLITRSYEGGTTDTYRLKRK